MEKSQSPLFAELALDADTQDFTTQSPAVFGGVGSIRQERALHALILRPRKREDVDRIAGSSNGPDLIMRIRKRGLVIPCSLVPGIDRDGQTVKFGVYSLTDDDRRKITAWQRKRKEAAQ